MYIVDPQGFLSVILLSADSERKPVGSDDAVNLSLQIVKPYLSGKIYFVIVNAHVLYICIDIICKLLHKALFIYFCQYGIPNCFAVHDCKCDCSVFDYRGLWEQVF